MPKKVLKQAKAKCDGVINPQIYNLKQLYHRNFERFLSVQDSQLKYMMYTKITMLQFTLLSKYKVKKQDTI